MAVRSIALSVGVMVMVAGCSTSPTAAIHSTTCADWRSMAESARTELVTAIVDANDLLEAVRAVQHVGPAAPRAALLQEVVGSVTKNCQAIGRPDQLVLDITLQLYGAGRASDGYVGASGSNPSPATKPHFPEPRSRPTGVLPFPRTSASDAPPGYSQRNVIAASTVAPRPQPARRISAPVPSPPSPRATRNASDRAAAGNAPARAARGAGR